MTVCDVCIRISFHYIYVPTPGSNLLQLDYVRNYYRPSRILHNPCLCVILVVTDDYLIVAEDTSILHMSLNGSDLEILHNDVNGRAYGIDYHFA